MYRWLLGVGFVIAVAVGVGAGWWLQSAPQLSEPGRLLVAALDEDGWERLAPEYDNKGGIVLYHAGRAVKVTAGSCWAKVEVGDARERNGGRHFAARHLTWADLYHVNNAVQRASERLESAALTRPAVRGVGSAGP